MREYEWTRSGCSLENGLESYDIFSYIRERKTAIIPVIYTASQSVKLTVVYFFRI